MGTPTGNPATSRLAARARLAFDQRDVGGSASHVEREDARKAAARGHRGSAYQSACRSGKHGTHRFTCRRLQRGDPAARLHDEDACFF